jgi:predicted DNA-binding transcriptional regulator AlpA
LSKNPIGGSAQKQEPIPRDLQSVSAVSVRLDMSERAVWQWAREGRLPAPIRMGKRFVRWRKTDIDEFIERGCTMPTGGAA